MFIVYRIKNKINEKSYVGYTGRTIDQRWKSHLSASRQGSKFRFHSAIRKYGVDCWEKEVLFKFDDIDCCKKKEEEIILIENLTNSKFGYNAKPGGCGGFIVPPCKYDNWRKNVSNANIGEKNSNYSGYSNDEIIKISKSICEEYKRILSHKEMCDVCIERGIKFPKSFTKFRFDGNYKNLVLILENITNLKYDPHWYKKTKEFKDSARLLLEQNRKKYVKNKKTRL